MKEQVLKLRQQGLSYDKISQSLHISKSTVAYHCNDTTKQCVQRQRKINRKKTITMLKLEAGGKCSKCGYSRCLEALDFHHLDPTTKDKTYHSLAEIVANCSIAKAKEEILKCKLICSNCHREIHAGITTLE